MVFPSGTSSEVVISVPASVAFFRPAQRFDDADCSCAAIEPAASRTSPIVKYLNGNASQEVRAAVAARSEELSTIPTSTRPSNKNKSLYLKVWVERPSLIRLRFHAAVQKPRIFLSHPLTGGVEALAPAQELSLLRMQR